MLGAVLGARVAPAALTAFRARSAELAVRSTLLARTQAEIAAGATLVDSVPQLREEMLAMAPHIVAGAGEAEAAEGLAARLGMFAENHHAKLLQATAIPDSVRAGRLRRVTVRMTMEGDTRGVIGVLRGIERDSVVLSVDEAAVSTMDPFTLGGGPEALRADITVHGWFLEREQR
ncbi:MAG TPA: GspMb/PilO family protein [Gemmatimonadales bacterium]|nr:GspMb/PilO family protein [Gemmatimonadales bacterium]